MGSTSAGIAPQQSGQHEATTPESSTSIQNIIAARLSLLSTLKQLSPAELGYLELLIPLVVAAAKETGKSSSKTIERSGWTWRVRSTQLKRESTKSGSFSVLGSSKYSRAYLTGSWSFESTSETNTEKS